MRAGPNHRGRIISLEGPSGVGKTSVGRELAARLDAAFLPEAVDAMAPTLSLDFRTLPQLRRLERALIDEEARRYRVARRTIARGRDVVADTGFFGPLTYSVALAQWDRRWDVVRSVLLRTVGHISTGSLGLPQLCLYLDADGRTLQRRTAADPIGHPAALTLRHQILAPLERRYWETSGTRRWSRVDARGPRARVLDVVESRCRNFREPTPVGREVRFTEALSFVSGALAIDRHPRRALQRPRR
ncbi:MAG: AAA family ATPase [Thermoplasmata archaeon]|nr:AAA family ATPase [Thermoplasmata archaeon]